MPKKFGPAGDYRPLKVGTLKVKLLHEISLSSREPLRSGEI